MIGSHILNDCPSHCSFLILLRSFPLKVTTEKEICEAAPIGCGGFELLIRKDALILVCANLDCANDAIKNRIVFLVVGSGER